ncbi:PREDICTED: RING finger protein 10-like [Fragaria vesca subsp. vesca]
MSILPNQNQGSNSSSSSIPFANPNSQHGNHHDRHLFQPQSLSRQNIAFGSLDISDSHSPTSPGPSLPAPQDSLGSSQEVTELGLADNNVMPNHERHSQSRSGGNGRGAGSYRSRGKRSGSQQSIGTVASHGSSPQPAGRRSQMMNGNHLLNFHYDPISRPQARGPPPPPARRQHKRKAYNKDLFLQANYKFVVLDAGNYSAESMDPDKMLRWEDIICVRYSTPTLVQCPICLEYPLCPQITSCGHIFCFPCILQYLLMGKEDHKGDSWKRCPLCFVMISPKDLYTLFVENVKQYSVGDSTEFMLLSRQKDSFTISHKIKQEKDAMPGCDDESYDPFSKFTFTSDVDLSVRKAISELDAWLVRADAGLVDDLEKLPYVCAAMEHLEQRKKYWNEHRAIDNNKTGSSVVLATANPTNGNSEASIIGDGTLSNGFNDSNKCSESLLVDKSDDGTSSDQSVDAAESLEGHENLLSSSYDESKTVQGHSHFTESVKEKDSYNFYQAADGQHMILHPLNMKCLLHHYGSHDMLPHRINGRILQLETVTQSEALRRRYRYLSHFSLTTILQFCEIDLSELLSPDALSPFMEDIKKRERQRKQLARKERKEQIKAESAMAYPIPIVAGFAQSFHDESPTFSMDDFEALGSTSVTSSSPPIVGERRLFSSVTKLGFAAGHDSPSLKLDGTNSLNGNDAGSSLQTAGTQNAGVTSFANITSRAKPEENLDAPKINGSGKKGKKQSRVLLSTTGGRRY